ncbi:restriction endonuclease subunit S [Lactiplantibacillus plantarum]|uniref:restriction endonuclease subunit S n=1 Tax=Lactiplantibacillus plantarum TaxID=1590 RepID=UPI000FF80799|nr:restriction endonuclease subunit S [Lactiplantibacillus plantarum]QHM32504.1 hypothetical protein C7M34_03170 [Lactiplantibacillus plantarum]RWZ46006.1 restriction endonuclease subunit S [Lactiplantibacillus plantarum]
MKDNQAKYPQLRFKGFTDPWEERKLGEVTEKIGSGKTPKGGNSIYQNHGIALIRSQNIFNDRVNNNDIAYISAEVDTDMKNSRVFKNDVLLNITGASIGRSAVYQSSDTANVNQHVCIIRPKDNISSNFIQLNISSSNGQKEIELNQAGGGREGLNFQQIARMNFSYPSYDEQKLIGLFFKKINDTIALHQRKLDLLKEQKKGYLQKMFPKNGAKVPELRFAGFADAWEERKLGDAVSISSGVTGDATLQDGEYRLTRIESISQGMLNVARLGFTNEKPDQKYLLNLGDILYSNINSLSHIGKVALVDTAGIYHGINLLRFQMRNDVDSEFLFQRLNTMPMKSWAVSHANPAVSQASINQTELSKQPISSPTITEQQKIGSFFKQLDDTIALHQRKLEKLQELKKGYLQKMFC